MNALGQPRSVLVLGGTSDIGSAIVRRFVGSGVRRVVLAGRDTEALRRHGEALVGQAELEVVAFDALETDTHAEMIDQVFDLGDVDVVVLAFGQLGDQAVAESEPAHAVQLARVNYVGAVSTGLHVAARFRRQGHGSLVVLSSVAGERARRSNFVYGSTKAGLDAFSQGLGDALQGTGARVLVVRPGFVRSRMTAGMDEVPFSTTPDAVAQAVVQGLERGSETIWVPGVLRAIMAVLRHLPRVIFRRLPI